MISISFFFLYLFLFISNKYSKVTNLEILVLSLNQNFKKNTDNYKKSIFLVESQGYGDTLS